jgi:transposase
MVVVEGSRLPIGYAVASAQHAEVRLAEQTLASIRVPQPRGRPKTRLQTLVADRGYDSHALRQSLGRRGIRADIPPKRCPSTWRRKRGRPISIPPEHRRRWIVEQTFAWLGTYRRVLIRWRSIGHIYEPWFVTTLTLLCLRRLTLPTNR